MSRQNSDYTLADEQMYIAEIGLHGLVNLAQTPKDRQALLQKYFRAMMRRKQWTRLLPQKEVLSLIQDELSKGR